MVAKAKANANLNFKRQITNILICFKSITSQVPNCFGSSRIQFECTQPADPILSLPNRHIDGLFGTNRRSLIGISPFKHSLIHWDICLPINCSRCTISLQQAFPVTCRISSTYHVCNPVSTTQRDSPNIFCCPFLVYLLLYLTHICIFPGKDVRGQIISGSHMFRTFIRIYRFKEA
jgi:hypothetical protein